MDLEHLGEPCKDCKDGVRWVNSRCPKCGANYCFTCACRMGWKCPKCGNELV
jgi:transcription initiation factor IIE alpha subunit